MNAINLTPEPGDELVRMKNSGNSDQLNLGTRAFFPDHRKAFWIPAKDAGRVLSEPGGFYLAPLTKAEGLQDVAGAVVAMPECREKAALGQAIADLFEDAPEA
jgi:hypothetical protein